MDKSIILSNLFLWFAIFIFDSFIYAVFFYIVLNKKVNFLRAAIFGFASGIISVVLRISLPADVVSYTGLLIIVLATTLILGFTILQSIIAVFLSSIVGILTDFAAIFICKTYIFNNASNSTLSNPLVSSESAIIAFILYVLITILIYYSKISISHTEDIKTKKNFGLVLNSVVTLLLMFPNIWYFTTSGNDFPKGIIVYNLLAIIIFFLLCIYNTYKGTELNLKNTELEYEKLYNKTLNDLVDSLKGFKHDYANTLDSIGGYLALEDIKGLNTYFDQLSEDYLPISSLSFANSTITNNPPVYGIIVSKFYLLQSKGIKFDMDITTDICNPKMKIYELTKVLGILLDNAIEACEITSEKFIKLTIKYLHTGNKYIIRIENSFEGTVNIQDIFKKGFSSKKAGRGTGLWEVKNITQKNKYISLRTSVNKNIFIQELSIESN